MYDQYEKNRLIILIVKLHIPIAVHIGHDIAFEITERVLFGKPHGF